jgi:hypothetical protein
MTLQRHSAGRLEPDSVPPIVYEVLRSPGQPLDADTRAFFEPRFGHDFSQVRVHTDSRAAESAQLVNALAYTVGHNVVFGAKQYAPATLEGQRLLAHELTHTIQQHHSSFSLGNSCVMGRPNDIAEGEAERAAHSPLVRDAWSHNAHFNATGSQVALQRQVTHGFPEERFAPVREAFEENAKKATRDSCIIIVNKGLRKLFVDQFSRKGKKGEVEPIRGEWVKSMEAAMGKLQAMHLAEKPSRIELLTAKGRTAGTLPPDSLQRSARAEIVSLVGAEPGWYLFGLSIMDGYHSVLIAVDNRIATAQKIYWMDQIFSGFDDVTSELDSRITRLTKSFWNTFKGGHGFGSNTTLRIWPIVERLVGDFPPLAAPRGEKAT